ncbi:origin recognition complex subunit 4 [Extremus antarcticus]|uniref:Origin recognition complex subunit 4 n=1 Tax=Extremus antarcticus TaxID=702011 RepID=A0AAJ0DC97_9PEZI|nr:origin recognition complex subunit 4 [Extremus antarcticus]
MDSHRSTKRRKLDTTPNASPRNQLAGRSKAATSTKPTNSATDRLPNGLTAQSRPLAKGSKGNTAAHDAWLEAKANIQALRGKRPGHILSKDGSKDVYDDIDGAHTFERKFKQNPAPASTPSKKRLDPLRNQRSGSTVQASPSKGAVAAGFFKQFHQPKAQQAETAEPKDDVRKEVLSKAPAVAESVGKPAKNGFMKRLETSKSEQPIPPTNVKPGWDYAAKPKRTFEDEIHDLANAAREQAKRGDDDESAAQMPQKRRSRVRAQQQDVEAETASKPERTPTAAKRSTPAVQSRKQARTKPIKPSPVPTAVSATDAMDVDSPGTEVDDEIVLPPNKNLQQANDELDTTPVKPRPKSVLKPAVLAKGLTFGQEELQQVQAVVLDKLSGKRAISLKGLDTEYAKVSLLITQTITAGESNSMLVIGARGSGKSALVDQILREQAKQHGDDFHIVRLSGFIHTDDKIALREIWRQLGREMEVDDDASGRKNYADTLTTLLALLAHPAEHGREQQEDQITKSVIFIIDEFELFATHPRQTLLYNLFDIAQSRKAPIAVLGLTTRVDVTESLEKRVKSRFSHRYVHLSIAKSFQAFQEACKAALALDNEELTDEERQYLGSTGEIQQKLQKTSKTSKQSAVSDWNALIDVVMAHETFTTQLRRLYYTTKSVPQFHTSMLLPIATMPIEQTTTAEALLSHLTTAALNSSMQPPDSKLDLLSSLSTLHMALLICAARLTAIHSVDNVPFAQAYEEYKTLASKAKLQASSSGALAQGAGSRVWSKDVARDAWEDLEGCGLIMEDGTRGPRIDVGLEESGMSGVDLGSWGRWCRQI